MALIRPSCVAKDAVVRAALGTVLVLLALGRPRGRWGRVVLRWLRCGELRFDRPDVLGCGHRPELTRTGRGTEREQHARQRDEEEYREEWAAEQLRAKQTLEEELRALRQESMNKQEALDRDLQEREQRIMQKEKEMDLLTKELEQFMSRLAGRTQLKASAQDDSPDSCLSTVKDV